MFKYTECLKNVLVTFVIDLYSGLFFCFLFLFLFCCFRAAPVACGSPRLGVKSEQQLLAYTTATATLDPRPIIGGQGSNPHPLGY